MDSIPKEEQYKYDKHGKLYQKFKPWGPRSKATTPGHKVRIPLSEPPVERHPKPRPASIRSPAPTNEVVELLGEISGKLSDIVKALEKQIDSVFPGPTMKIIKGKSNL